MSNCDLFDLVTSTGDLATLPDTVVRLLELLEDPTCSADRIVEVLDTDPAMTANVLKLGNSAYYGVRREIASVRDALVMLGNRSVVTLAFATSMAPIMRNDLDGYGIGRDQFWNHSLMTAAGSSLMADRLGIRGRRSEAFTAGLIHDLGMLLVDRALTRQGVQLPNGRMTFDVRGAERATLGFDHCEAGLMLATHWGLPDVLLMPIRWHHQPAEAEQDAAMVQAVAVGNALAQIVQDNVDLQQAGPVCSMLNSLGLDEPLVQQLHLDLSRHLKDTLTMATGPVSV